MIVYALIPVRIINSERDQVVYGYFHIYANLATGMSRRRVV